MLVGFNVTVPLRSGSGDFYSVVLDLRPDRGGTKELAMNAVANAQVWHRRLGHLHVQSLDIVRKRYGTGITFEWLPRNVMFAPWRKLNSLFTPGQPTTRSIVLSSCAAGT